MAATLANGGICPITGDRVLSDEAVRNTLSLMHSCGMWGCQQNLEFRVLFCWWFPMLWACCVGPHHWIGSEIASEEFTSVKFALSAVDMEQRDYDSRTALHIAAAEGNTLHH
ncbi:hypothetical protein GOODEAATRI_004012 [Goodea atripinnis]|uniref:glutaminase n=1 Tax=Goodea atripinnis TaxID=208336 RepID=A0ABV0MP51_9TELE